MLKRRCHQGWHACCRLLRRAGVNGTGAMSAGMETRSVHNVATDA